MIITEKSISLNEKSKQLSWKQFSKAFLNASPNGIVVTDCSFKTAISNKKAQEYLDIFTGTLIQTTLPELTEHSTAVLKDTITLRDIQIIRHNKKFMTRISPIIWKEITLGLFYLFEDVTTLEKVSKKMKSYQEISMELDTIINSSHDGFWICDGQGKVIRINPASEELTGIRAEKFIGKFMQELVDKRFIDRSVTLKVLKSQKKETIIQHTKHGKNLLLTATPVFDKEGQLFRVVVNERDITEIETLKKEIEEKQALKAELEEDLLEMQIEASKAKKIIAKSHNLKTILKKAVKISRVDSSVLILGESGTGKGMIAEMIHYHSNRRDKPMIRLNCGTIPESLVESELFGYKKGAFTGADKNKAGRFEVADKGILFLDEIAELPLSSQVKLLRFLEDGHLSRIGDTASKKVNVRIIAATNQNLEKMVADKTFRQDLYYRLKVIPLHLPSLRDRKECILPLISHYIKYFCKKHKIKGPIKLTNNAGDAMEKYAYPGNVRELINICERLVVMNENNKIHYNDLPHSVMDSAKNDNLFTDIHDKGLSLREMMTTFEKQILKDIMNKHLTQSKAAKVLGLNQSTIARKLQKYKLI
ncbi:MAG: sigma 54-interacting transcriptional regulator [Desulfobacula sp.]|uniref:sigma 54-interacting transcriptional regulator n=1 Tax=Desulfobacula sp. TaxID=2593537 RepID=UPI0025C38DF0|nr:sigma 54-interacting transcriptional regulator [Desulfobacula sp.]MCD4719943.1 sigma 54-interacting transcriptional regulator [Desulfobacula sp.]